MTICRIRLERDSLSTDSFEWAVLDPKGSRIDSGSSPMQRPPTGMHCELVVASDLVLLESIPAPPPRQRRISSALRFLVEESVIPDPERIHVAVGPVSTSNMMAVAIIDRQWLSHALARLEALGLAPRYAYPECLLPPLQPGTWTIVCRGDGGFVRTGDQAGFALDRIGSDAPPMGLRLALDRARDAAIIPERLIVRATPGTAVPSTEGWPQALGLPVERGAEWNWTEPGSRPALDLLQAEFAPRVTERNWTRALRRPAILAAALAIVVAGGTAMEWAMKLHERRGLVAQMAEIYRRSFGENAAVVDPPLQMARGLDQLRRQSGEFTSADFVPLLAAVSERLLDPSKHRIDAIGYADGVLTLTVRPIEAARFSALFNEMRDHISIPGIDVKLEPAESSGRFSLRATAGGGGAK